GEGCEVYATSRHYRETDILARAQGLRLRFVGRRGGKDLAEQLTEATRRQEELIPLINSFEPDVSISAGSAVCARISFGLRVRHVTINDSPHSAVADRLSLPLSHRLFCPWIIPYESWYRYGVGRGQISRYRALDPAAWLKRRAPKGEVPKLERNRETIVVRLEETYAPYMADSKKSWNEEILSALARSFRGCNLVALCRYGDQLRHMRRRFGETYILPEAVDGRALLEKTDVFVGMGGTMTAEASLMGVPSVSAFQGSLYTEKYLLSVKLLDRATSTRQVAKVVGRLMAERTGPRKKRARRVLASMEDPVSKISSLILGLPP
ncbi:MAG TPA: DUF354 domain-containing protein, partial [Nitrososphaerales archaeon]|nr:DUF354 domain-containing protein [Nitrososphaerales archaeon]